MTYTNREKADEAKREVGQRKWVYANRVSNGRLTQAKSDRQIGIMQEIYEDYAKLAEAEDKASRLL